MTFSYTRKGIEKTRKSWESWGTFTNAGSDTGGDIYTGIGGAEVMLLQHTGSAVVASAPVINETLPKYSDGISILCTADADGVWWAKNSRHSN